MPTAATLKLIDHFSLEMTGKDVEALREAAPSIPSGTKINVTFLGNEDLSMRVNAAQAVRELGFTPVPHISARRLSSEAHLRDFLAALQEVEATEHIFAVGGDPVTPEGPYPDSLSIIRSGVLAEFGVREVSIAGYPEGHPDITDDVLWAHLSKKCSALRDQGLSQVVLTQFAFDADRVAEWIREVRDHNVDAQIRIGTPGPAGIKRLLNYARRFGVGSSAGIVKKYGFSLTNLMGTAGPDKFMNSLGNRLETDPQAGDVRTHFYTFGGMKATADWAEAFVAGA